MGVQVFSTIEDQIWIGKCDEWWVSRLFRYGLGNLMNNGCPGFLYRHSWICRRWQEKVYEPGHLETCQKLGPIVKGRLAEPFEHNCSEVILLRGAAYEIGNRGMKCGDDVGRA